MKLQDITLVTFGNVEKIFLEQIAETVMFEFHNSVFIKEEHVDLIEYYDPSRRQYNGNMLLKRVGEIANEENRKVIGIFSVDIFIPILTFIFGQAVLNGSTGIVSFYRLKNESYGLKKDKNILLERLKKELIHELGHTFGLIHCFSATCVMRSSTYVEDIDLKTSGFCSKCRIELGFTFKH